LTVLFQFYLHKQRMTDSLRELEKCIKSTLYTNNGFETLRDIVRDYEGTDWKAYVRVSSENYVREKVIKNKLFEIYIITWAPKQGSPIHHHSCNGCWLKVLKGELQETIYDESLNPTETHTLKRGAIGFMHNNLGTHSVQNDKENHTVSLHIYSPPGFKCKCYHS
jgi:cysteine dioxygenase